MQTSHTALRTFIEEFIQTRARAVYSQILLSNRGLKDPKDIFEELESWAPDLVNQLSRQHKELNITDSVLSNKATASSSTPSVERESKQGPAKSKQKSFRPKFPVVHSKSQHPDNPDETEQEEDMLE